MNVCVCNVSVCSGSFTAFFPRSPYFLLTPVVKYVYVHFWIIVRKVVMLISHCVLQLHQGDSLRKGGMFFMQMAVRMKIGLNRAKNKETTQYGCVSLCYMF